MTMITWIKKLWHAMGESYFFTKYALPTLGLFFTWGFLGHIYTANLELDDLTEATGTVRIIHVVQETSGIANRYYPLLIGLEGRTEEFRIRDRFERKYPDIIKKINVGKKVTIYTRNQLQTIIGMGKRSDIYQIDVSNETVFKLGEMQQYLNNQKTTFGIFAGIIWVAYIFYRTPKLRNLFDTYDEEDGTTD